jgi:hypothetical protein
MAGEVREHRPRLSIEITEEQAYALSKLIPWGAKNELFRTIIEDVITLLEKHGPIIIAAILTRRLTIRDLDHVKEVIPK